MGIALIIIGLILMIVMSRAGHKSDAQTQAFGVQIQGPAGLIVVIMGVACLVLGNVDTVKALWSQKSSASVVVTVTSATPSNSPSPMSPGTVVFPEALNGTWAGVYQQSDGRLHQMELAITANVSTAQVRYPSLGCFGTVTAVSRSEQSLRAQESILNGGCTPTGTLTIELRPNGQLAISYIPDSATYTARAALGRTP